MSALIHLALVFSMLSLLAVGGGTAVLPEMQTVLAQRYSIDHTTFVHIYSIGQLAPGPNMMMVLVFGFQIAGLLGALVVLLSFFIPSSLLCLFVGRLWTRIGEGPMRRAVQNALEPISIGLMCSGVFAVAKSAIAGPVSISLAVITFTIILLTRINPVYIILTTGSLGALLMHIAGLK
ncbi:chromate transporter [Orrella sp. NBD-18]|uniref:Chromate transporter n=1 Tax=Sheuella amnicola TaxID=2707330 RepID=A0A6B2R3W5_9BURK|nr:chromate transporter [Sheuella amnicola]NDY84414.1 chromate transporter [Sheuella amnicola]